MSSNVGLNTPRGSGTSGYVQRNLSLLKPRSTGAGAPYSLDASSRAGGGPKQRKPDQAILAHDRLREVEVRVLELRDRLEDAAELDEDEVDAECDRLRANLVADMEEEKKRPAASKGPIKGYKVHELAEAKAKESERLRRALGLRPDEAPVGDEEDGNSNNNEHPMARQERKKREREAEKVKAELERDERERERDRHRDRSP